MKDSRPTRSTDITHLSWSAISEYQSCPRRYWFRRIARAKDERVAATLVQGTGVHRGLELLHRARLAGQRLPSVDRLLRSYDGHWADAEADKIPISYSKTQTTENLRSSARGMLSAYRDHVASSNARVLGIETDISFRTDVDRILMLARADLLTIEKSTLVVTDWKTSRGTWSPSKLKEGQPQVVIYKIAARRLASDLGLRQIATRFVILTKTRTPHVQVVEPHTKKSDEARVADLIDETAAGIRAGIFPRRENWQCHQCPFRDACQRT
jgi:CRISPR/Cas system-associated exonuclease Cas4 (RecB family)